MKKYVRTYLDFFDYPHDQDSFVGCEYCNARACDIHHIKGRQMGGSKQISIVDDIHNLIALCRKCHEHAESSKDFNKRIRIIHLKKIIKQLEIY